MWLSKFRQSFLQSILDLLWRQWTALGVLGQIRPVAPFPLDPESLIVATIHFGRYDPRLFDGALEWWLMNGEWISGTRLRNLQRKMDSTDKRILASMIQVTLLEQKPQKWGRLARESYVDLQAESGLGLFLRPDGRTLPHTGHRDPVFLQFGLIRPPFEKRGVAQEVRADNALNLRIRLRGLFGVTSRAEILLYLLSHQTAHPRLIARQAAYSHPSIATALTQMSFSGVVTKHRLKREVRYEVEYGTWADFLDLGKRVEWVDWARIFSALRRAHDCVSDLESKSPSSRIVQSEIRKCAGRINALLEESEVGYQFEIPNQMDAEDDELRWFRRGWELIFKKVGMDMEFARLESVST